MSAVRKLRLLTEEQFLAEEKVSPVKREYISGVVEAMAGASAAHNIVAVNVLTRLYARVVPRGCRPFNSDMLVRVRLQGSTRFYYPDVSVFCNKLDGQSQFLEQPIMVVEVLSPSTRRTDRIEKCEAYLSIAELQYYVIVDPSEPSVMVYRRSEREFVNEVYTGLEASIPLAIWNTELPLAEIYAGVDFVPVANEVFPESTL